MRPCAIPVPRAALCASAGLRRLIESHLDYDDLENAALPILTELRDRTGETSQLWVRRGGDRLCLASVDSMQQLRATLPPGTRQPLPAGSAGRLLAEEDEALASVRERGWVESVGVRTPGLGSVSTPVTVAGELLGAVAQLAAGEVLGRAAVVIVVAGMEGALPSVVGGLVAWGCHHCRHSWTPSGVEPDHAPRCGIRQSSFINTIYQSYLYPR